MNCKIHSFGMHVTRCHLHLTLKNFFSGKLAGILMAKGR